MGVKGLEMAGIVWSTEPLHTYEMSHGLRHKTAYPSQTPICPASRADPCCELWAEVCRRVSGALKPDSSGLVDGWTPPGVTCPRHTPHEDKQ